MDGNETRLPGTRVADKPFRGLSREFLNDLKESKLKYILDFEHKNRKALIIEIRNDFLDLYFLGHSIVVRRIDKNYCLTADEQFNPAPLLSPHLSGIVETYGSKWKISFSRIDTYEDFENIIASILGQIVKHRKGSISEGVSELNHFIQNRTFNENGILVIDRQVVYPGEKGHRIDLLGLKRHSADECTFAVIELKNRNNREIGSVFSQIADYIDIVYGKYDEFLVTYDEIIKQKRFLHLLKGFRYKIASKRKVEKRDIEGIVVIDNFNIKGERRLGGGLLHRALNDWEKNRNRYNLSLYLKTNVLDRSFFWDYERAKFQLKEILTK